MFASVRALETGARSQGAARLSSFSPTVLFMVTGLATPAMSRAQGSVIAERSWLESTAGSDVESYVRLLSLDSTRAAYTVSERTFSPREIRTLIARAGRDNPWASRFSVGDTSRRLVRVTVLRPSANTTVNTGYAFGINDGPVWAGRGLTGSLQQGAVIEVGPLTVRVEPVLWGTQNAAFPLYPGGTGTSQYAYPVVPTQIDLPQRFGPHTFGRLDAGNSEARLDVFGLAAGVSNANEVWGPAVTHPLILGANAPGFLHVFAGTGRPLPLGIGTLSFRLEAGRLEQSAYSPAPDSLATRLMSGAVASFVPAGPLHGLEIGASRFYHRRWTGHITPSDLTFPLRGFLFKQGHFDSDNPASIYYSGTNQLASIFARWTFPRVGLEVYGELYRDDAAVDFRDLTVEPDHQMAYMLGFQRLVRSSARRWSVWRGEVVNARTTNIDRVRLQGLLYGNTVLRQGHTNRGEILGSPAVPGGGGSVLGFDRYTPEGKTTFELHRLLRLHTYGEGAATPEQIDAQYALLGNRTVFRRGIDVRYGGGLVYELNRNFQHDAANVVIDAGIRWGRTSTAR